MRTAVRISRCVFDLEYRQIAFRLAINARAADNKWIYFVQFNLNDNSVTERISSCYMNAFIEAKAWL